MYYENQFNENKNNIKKTWALLREVTKKSKDKSCVINEIKVGEHSIHNPKHIAEYFNEFFSSIGDKIAAEIIPTSKIPEDYLTGDFPNELSLYLTTPEEIIGITKKFKFKYSSDLYGLFSYFIKKNH